MVVNTSNDFSIIELDQKNLTFWSQKSHYFFSKLAQGVGPGRPLALPEPEPTRPFDLSLSEPTYLHRPDLFNLFGLSKS